MSGMASEGMREALPMLPKKKTQEPRLLNSQNKIQHPKRDVVYARK